MAFVHSPKIVTDGLVLALDAGNVKSYPGSGTTWLDKSGRGNNGTLINGPTFSSANLGSIVFDGTNDYVDWGNKFSSTQGTIGIWFKTTNAGSSFRALINKSEEWGLFLQDNILITYDWGNAAARSTGLNLATGNWYHVMMTFTTTTGTPSNNAIIYLNGSSILTTTVKQSRTNFNFQIGAQNGSQNLNGSIASGFVYNRALTPSEILQNYNATKGRFGL
jgi:hypothetical protein